MSIVYACASVLTLNAMAPPTLTLIWVAYPRIVWSSPPSSHTLAGVPGSWFSHAIALPQDRDAAWATGTGNPSVMSTSTKAAADHLMFA